MKKPVILCVDDEKMIVDTLRHQLYNRLGTKFDIELALSGEEAIELCNSLKEQQRDLAVIISDQAMPNMSGDEMLSQLHSTHPESYKILLTGNVKVEAVSNAINKARLYRLISKPWDETELLQTVEKAAQSFIQNADVQERTNLYRSLNKDMQDLYGEVELHRIIGKFMQKVIEKSGSERAYLLFTHKQRLNVEAASSKYKDEAKLLAEKLAKEPAEINRDILEKVQETMQGETVMEWRVVVPITKKSKVVGYIYLENADTKLPISYNQIEILQVLASQALVSMENADLYARLEDKAAHGGGIALEKGSFFDTSPEAPIETPAEDIPEQNADLASALRFARLVQESTMPNPRELQQFYPESFMLFRTRSIVSSDFYWFTEKYYKFIMAMVDSNWIDIPAGFIQVLVTKYLSQICEQQALREPNLILAQLQQKLRAGLNTNTTEYRFTEKMGIAVVSIDQTNGVLEYSSANLPLLLYRKKKLKELVSQPVTLSLNLDEAAVKNFKCEEESIEPGDILYIFTAGVINQLNADGSQVFGYKRFKELIEEVTTAPIAEQALLIERIVTNWMGSQPQTQDFLVVGIKIPQI